MNKSEVSSENLPRFCIFCKIFAIFSKNNALSCKILQETSKNLASFVWQITQGSELILIIDLFGKKRKCGMIILRHWKQLLIVFWISWPILGHQKISALRTIVLMAVWPLCYKIISVSLESQAIKKKPYLVLKFDFYTKYSGDIWGLLSLPTDKGNFSNVDFFIIKPKSVVLIICLLMGRFRWSPNPRLLLR